MLVPSYNDYLVTIARTIDPGILGIGLAEQWQRLRVHRVQLDRYLNPEGLSLLQKEIETTQDISLPYPLIWLKPLESIQKRYNSKEIAYSTIVITIQTKELAETIIAKGLYFGGYNHPADRFWRVGQEEICPKCCQYGHQRYKACIEVPRCYICAGAHEAAEHECPIKGCTAKPGKGCIHLPCKCIHCQGPHMAIAGHCPKRKEAIEKAKAIKIAQRQTQTENTRRENISVIVPKVTGQWSTSQGFVSQRSTNQRSASQRSNSQRSTSQGSTSQESTSQESTGQKTTGQRPNSQRQPTVEEVDPWLEPGTPSLS
jgi:hypothetical protein